MLTIYLAGDVDHDWRKIVIKLADNHFASYADRRRVLQFLCPKDPAGNTEENDFHSDIFIPSDLIGIWRCDAVLAMRMRAWVGIGTAAECGMAYALNKPIYLTCIGEVQSRDRFLCSIATSVFNSIESACEAVFHAAEQNAGK